MSSILSATAIFIAVSIDYVFILFALFSQVSNQSQKWQIIIGQYLATLTVLIASIVVGMGLDYFIDNQWIIGILGLLPIYLAIQMWTGSQTDEPQTLLNDSSRSLPLFIGVMLIILASSGDDMSILIPYITTLSTTGIVTTICVFIILTGVLCFTAYRLNENTRLNSVLSIIKRWFVPFILIILGVYILMTNQTLSSLLSVLLNEFG